MHATSYRRRRGPPRGYAPQSIKQSMVPLSLLRCAPSHTPRATATQAGRHRMGGAPHARLDAAHHAEVVVDEAAAADCVDRHVARVRVRMEEAVAKKLLEVGFDGEAREARAVEAHLVNGAPVVDLHARHVLHHDHLLAEQLVVDLWHLDPVGGRKVGGEVARVLRLHALAAGLYRIVYTIELCRQQITR